MKQRSLLLLSVLFLFCLSSSKLNAQSEMDSFPLIGDFTQVKYQNMMVYKIDSNQYLLSALGYENVLEVYYQKTAERRDLLQEFRTGDNLKEIYRVQLGGKNAENALKLRNQFITTTGRLGNIKELELLNIELQDEVIRVSYGLRMVLPDSSHKTATILVEYKMNFEIQNWWISDFNPYLNKYSLGISFDDKILKEGKHVYLPIFLSQNSNHDTAYNLAQFQLTDKHKIQFIRLENFYHPKIKETILRPKMNKLFAARLIQRSDDTLTVIYNMMPFVYKPYNRISDTLNINPNLFVGDPKFKALRDSVRNQNGGFSIPYFHTISSMGDTLIVVAKEFGKLSLALYDKSFMLLSKVYLKEADIYPSVFHKQLVYLKRLPQAGSQFYIFQTDLSNFITLE